MAGITVYMPDGMQPELFIPTEIAKDFMIYGMIGYRDHNSEWGCALKLHRETPYSNHIHVVDYHMYELYANGGYWESIEGEREKHAADMIQSGNADDMQYWNGLFHTHPIGSGAQMSGTDKEQLEDLAGTDYWGVSVICPANKEAAVDPSKWLFHYADSRQFDNGMVVVANLKPTIGVEAKDTYDDYALKMKEIMHKKVYVTKSKDVDKIIGDAKSTADRAMQLIDPDDWSTWDIQAERLLGPGTYSVGDWVYVESVSLDEGVLSRFSDEEKEEFCNIAGSVRRVEEVPSCTSILVQSGKNRYYLSPQDSEYDKDPYIDFVYPLARIGTPAARLLDNQFDKNPSKPVRVTRKMFKDAGLDFPEHLSNTTNKNKVGK